MMGLTLFAKIQHKKKRIDCSERLAAWVGTIRREMTREEKAETFRAQNEGTYRSGERGGEPAMVARETPA